MSIIPNVPPRIFTLSAATLGFLLIDDMTANEQNALGNWLMLVGQMLCTNASHQYVKNERKNNETHPDQTNNTDTGEMLKKMRDALDRQIRDLQSK